MSVNVEEQFATSNAVKEYQVSGDKLIKRKSVEVYIATAFGIKVLHVPGVTVLVNLDSEW